MEPNPEKKQELSFQNTGAILTPVYVERQVRQYAISEHEMESLGDYSSEVTLWSSVGMFALGLLLASIWDMVTSGSSEDFNWINAILFALACSGVLVFSLFRLFTQRGKRKRTIERIKDETIIP